MCSFVAVADVLCCRCVALLSYCCCVVVSLCRCVVGVLAR